jgi:hypothetical protein
MTDKSGSSKNASHEQPFGEHERRRALGQFWDNPEQHAEIRAELEKASSAQEAQATLWPEKPGRYEAVLELLSGRNSATAELNKAVTAQYAALKSALTPERETALRLLATGQGSPKAIIDVLRSAPSLWDVLPLPWTPRIQAIRELLPVAAAGNEWDGFHDQYWTTGQTVLWAVTGDRWAVDQASNDSGRLGEIWGQDKAKVMFNAFNLTRERIRQAADELWRRCLSGYVKAIDDQGRPIPAMIG